MRSRRSALGTRQPTRGFTMTELLVSISIVAFLLLAGVGLYWRMNRGFALRAGVSSVESAMQSARAFAVHERSRTVVVLDPVPQNPFDPIRRLHAVGKRTVSCWHFEFEQIDGTKLHGALGQQGAISGVASSVPGKIGRALSFDGSGTSISVTSPYLDEIRDGVFLEAYVRPDANGLSSGARLPIASKADSGGTVFSLAISYRPTTSQDLFWLEGRVQAGSATLRARTEALIRAGEWSHVALAYTHDARDEDGDPLGVVLRVNGQEVDLYDVVAGVGRLAPGAAPLLIGREGGAHFKGRLDELKIGSLVAGDVYRLPENTEVRVDTGSSDGRIHFDDEGKLDARFHGRIVRFRVRSPRDDLDRVIQVNWLGGVEVLTQERQVQ